MDKIKAAERPRLSLPTTKLDSTGNMGNTQGVNTNNSPNPKKAATAQATLPAASRSARRWSSPWSLTGAAGTGATDALLLKALVLVPNKPSRKPPLLPGAGTATVASCGG